MGSLGHDLAGIPTGPVAADHFTAGGVIDRLHATEGQAFVAVGLEQEDPSVLAAIDEFRALDLGLGTIGIGEEPPLPLQLRLLGTALILRPLFITQPLLLRAGVIRQPPDDRGHLRARLLLGLIDREALGFQLRLGRAEILLLDH